jgi:hypothetical protein
LQQLYVDSNTGHGPAVLGHASCWLLQLVGRMSSGWPPFSPALNAFGLRDCGHYFQNGASYGAC